MAAFYAAFGFANTVFNWQNASYLCQALTILTPFFIGTSFTQGAYIQAKANQYKEAQTVTVRYNSNSGPIYEQGTVYVYYRDVWIKDTTGEITTQIENDTQYGNLLNGYDVCQAVHAGGDAQ